MCRKLISVLLIWYTNCTLGRAGMPVMCASEETLELTRAIMFHLNDIDLECLFVQRCTRHPTLAKHGTVTSVLGLKPWEARGTVPPDTLSYSFLTQSHLSFSLPNITILYTPGMDYSNYASQQSQPYSMYGLPTPDHQPQTHDDTLRDPFSLVRHPSLITMTDIP